MKTLIPLLLLNWQLSKNRAKSQALIERGISSTRINIYGYGADKPIVMGYDAASLAKNRRVVVKLINY